MIFDAFILTSRHHDIQFSGDIRFFEGDVPKPVVLFVHGFKGFKDWGTFNLIADHFAAAGFLFVKINLSHNGTTLSSPKEFVDLQAFAHNNFSIELDDLGSTLDYLTSPEENPHYSDCDLDHIFLLGHSRGGTLSILKACEDKRVRAVTSWAAVSDYPTRWDPIQLQKWKEKSVVYVLNGRTQQNMPLHYQIVEDFYNNRERVDLSLAIEKLQVPLLIYHAKDDPSVPVGNALQLKEWYGDAELKILPEGGHTFGGVHPYHAPALPPLLEEIVEETEHFFKREIKS